MKASHLRRLTWIALILLPVALAYHPLVNNDLPMHLAIGEWILDHQQIPATDPFSATAGGRRWVPHEWLSGVIFASVERVGEALGGGATADPDQVVRSGATALILLLIVLIGAVAWFHARVTLSLMTSESSLLVWSIPVWLTVGPRVMLRPHVFLWLAVFAIWGALLLARRRPRLGFVLASGVLALWVNLHGSFVLGLGIVGLELAFARNHAWSRGRRLALLATLPLFLLVQLQNYPQGDLLAGVRHAVGLASDPVFQEAIEEWKSPFASADFRSTIGAALAVFLLVAGATNLLVRGPGPVPRTYVMFVGVCLLLALRSHRFTALFALAVVPVLPRFELTGTRRLIPIGVTAALIFALLTWGLPVFWSRPPRRPGSDWHSRLPVVAVDALRDAGFGGPVLCEYQYGGVVAWRGRGLLRPTMDSRNSVYGAELFELHQGALAVDSVTAAQRAALEASSSPLARAELDRIERAEVFRDEWLGRATAAFLFGPGLDADRQGLHIRLRQDPRWEARVLNDIGWCLYIRVE